MCYLSSPTAQLHFIHLGATTAPTAPTISTAHAASTASAKVCCMVPCTDPCDRRGTRDIIFLLLLFLFLFIIFLLLFFLVVIHLGIPPKPQAQLHMIR